MTKKSILCRLALLMMIFTASALYGQISIIGFWEEVGVSDSRVLYAQDGNSLYVIGTYAINGQARLWYGSGQRVGNTITYSWKIFLGPTNVVNTARGTGKQYLTISSDGKTMTGKTSNDAGESLPLTMKKKSD